MKYVTLGFYKESLYGDPVEAYEDEDLVRVEHIGFNLDSDINHLSDCIHSVVRASSLYGAYSEDIRVVLLSGTLDEPTYHLIPMSATMSRGSISEYFRFTNEIIFTPLTLD